MPKSLKQIIKEKSEGLTYMNTTQIIKVKRVYGHIKSFSGNPLLKSTKGKIGGLTNHAGKQMVTPAQTSKFTRVQFSYIILNLKNILITKKILCTISFKRTKPHRIKSICMCASILYPRMK